MRRWRTGMPARRAASMLAPMAMTWRPNCIRFIAAKPRTTATRASTAGKGTPKSQPRPICTKQLSLRDRDGEALRHQQRHAAQHREARQRDDEGGDALEGDEPALRRADDGAGASSSRMTSGQGMPAWSAMAASALISATVEPTDRSMPPVVMTKVMAMATISSGEDWRSRLRRLPRGQEGRAGDGEDHARTAGRRWRSTAPARGGRGNPPGRSPAGRLV